jgi:dipeptidyl aminopeptidase/acylaminoacyl peptidase
MPRTIRILSLAVSLSLAGCAGNPFMHFINTTLGIDTGGQPPLATSEVVREIAPGVPADIGAFPSEGIRFSPDGTRFAYVHSPASGEPARIYLGQGDRPATATEIVAHSFLEWSPDGKRLAFAVYQESNNQGAIRYSLKALEVDTGSITTLLDDATSYFPWLSWSPDGSRILYTTGRNPEVPQDQDLNLHWRDVEKGEPTFIGIVTPARGKLAQWLPDGNQIMYRAKAPGFATAHNLSMFDRQDGTSRILRRIPREAQLVLNPTGEHVAYLEGQDTANVEGRFAMFRIRLSDGSTEETPFDLGKAMQSGTYSAAGFVSPDHRWCLVWHGNSPLFARDLATGKHHQVTSGPATPWAWVEDGTAIIVTTRYGATRHFYHVKVMR